MLETVNFTRVPPEKESSESEGVIFLWNSLLAHHSFWRLIFYTINTSGTETDVATTKSRRYLMGILSLNNTRLVTG